MGKQMIKKLLRRIVYFYFKKRGYRNSFHVQELLSSIKKDFQYRKAIGYRNIYQAYANGFTGMFYYKLKNAKISIDRCLPDLDYLKMHPLNGQFGHWIDDKLTLKYLLAKFDNYLPAYYGYLQKGRFIQLMDFPSSLPYNFEGFLDLLHQKEDLALKKNSGSLSVGFFNVKYCKGSYYINGNLTPAKEFSTFINSLDDYLITEYVHAHLFLKRINPLSPNIIRLIIVNIDGRDPQPIAAYLRIGQRSTGYTELTSSGGLFSGIDLNTGTLFDPKSFNGPFVTDTPIHPDSKVPIEGTLPHWDKLIDGIFDICKYVPNLKYLGFDIIITESSFKIIEINSLSGASYIQLFHPFLDSTAGKKFFQTFIQLNS